MVKAMDEIIDHASRVGRSLRIQVVVITEQVSVSVDTSPYLDTSYNSL